jgi:hypothetical protein
VFRGLLMELDLEHQTQVFVGTYEREIHGWLRRLSEMIEFGADVGAADGLYTLYLHERTTAVSVYAFEPDPAAFGLLEQNLLLNGLIKSRRLRVHMCGVSDVSGDGLVSLDSLAADSWERGLIKVDVEGGEVMVLEGARTLLRRPGVRWLIETHSLESEAECLSLLRSNGLYTSVVATAWWRRMLPETRPIAHNRWLVAYHPVVA